MRKKTLKYWLARNPREAAYSVRGRTRQECEEKRAELGAQDLEPPRRVLVTYLNAIDLINKCLGEDAAHWENA